MFLWNEGAATLVDELRVLEAPVHPKDQVAGDNNNQFDPAGIEPTPTEWRSTC